MTEALTRYSRSSSLALGALLAGLMLLGVGFAAFFIIFASEETFVEEADTAILAEMRTARSVAERGHNPLQAWFDEALTNNPLGFLYALKGDNNLPISGNIANWPEDNVVVVKEGLIRFEYASPPSHEHRAVVARIMTLPDGRFLLVGRDVTTLNTAQWFAQTFGWVMIALFVSFAVACLIVGWYVANRMNRIADTANRIINTGNLSERVPVDSSWDDLSKLSAVLNRLLGELETTMLGVKSVSDSIAHDLRTPLTRLRGDLDRLPESDTRDQLLDEVDNILNIFTSLLRITSIETERRKSAFADVQVDELLNDVVEMYEPLAEEKALSLHLASAPSRVYGDRDLLFQLFSNLLDNAIKFTGDGGVTIDATVDHNFVQVSVCDTGPGISPAEREKVLRRFYRVDKSRSQSGNGLGLAMVAAIVELHGAQLELAEGKDGFGLCCHLTFKRIS